MRHSSLNQPDSHRTRSIASCEMPAALASMIAFSTASSPPRFTARLIGSKCSAALISATLRPADDPLDVPLFEGGWNLERCSKTRSTLLGRGPWHAGAFDGEVAVSRIKPDFPSWEMVDEGWGRKAVDFSSLSEPGNCREYVALHHLLAVDAGDRLLDVACGSGLAIELARLRGADCAGIDASSRLVQVARFRNPGCDIRVGDMNELPWEEGAFDVVTSFRGIWGTTPAAVTEVYRVLSLGGRLGLTVWGHLKVSPGAWALAPFRLAAGEKVDNQAAMVSLGRPGAGETLLESSGFVDIRRVQVPFAWEFADPDLYARALASTGPAYEAIQNVGEDAFHEAAVEHAREHIHEGLPLRAEINVVGYLARKTEADLQP
jgi:SAM-dependent methyltransferase